MTNEPEWENKFDEEFGKFFEQGVSGGFYLVSTMIGVQDLKTFIKEEKEKSYRDGYKKGAISSDDVAFHIEREKSELLSKIEEEVQERRGVCKSMAEQTAQDGFALEVLAILSKYKV